MKAKINHEHTHHKTAKEDMVPLNQKTAVSFGAMSQAIANNALSAMANLIYNIELGFLLLSLAWHRCCRVFGRE